MMSIIVIIIMTLYSICILHVHSTAGLSTAVSLQYLDLSFNRIKSIIGLESLKNLKSLQLENNLVSNPTALRSLSLNRYPRDRNIAIHFFNLRN